MQRTLLALAVTAFLSTAALATVDVSKINGTLTVDAGEHAGSVRTVNGAVRIGSKASVEKASTVNGTVDMADGASAGEVSTVNGGMSLGPRAQITGDASNVNGRIKLDKGADIHGHLANVNGEIEMDGAHVGGGIETVNADIDIGEGSKVEGGILVKKPKSNNRSDRNPKIVIGPHATVTGDLVFERPVDLYVSDSATVGRIQGATAKKFSGSAP
jgi:cytoskeletal protein CcmA (bactofilin family)